MSERKLREAHAARAKADQDRERAARAGAAAVAASKADREKLSDAKEHAAALSDELQRLQAQAEEADRRTEVSEAELSAERQRGQEQGRREHGAADLLPLRHPPTPALCRQCSHPGQVLCARRLPARHRDEAFIRHGG